MSDFDKGFVAGALIGLVILLIIEVA